jgi:hypothetical protein
MHHIHLYEYYNVFRHKFLWLNGAAMNQYEEVLPVVTSLEFGIDNTGYGPFIRDRLLRVRRGIKRECD